MSTPPDTTEPAMVGTGYVARELGMSDMSIRRLIYRGQLPAIQLPSGTYRIKLDDVERLLATPAEERPA